MQTAYYYISVIRGFSVLMKNTFSVLSNNSFSLQIWNIHILFQRIPKACYKKNFKLYEDAMHALRKKKPLKK